MTAYPPSAGSTTLQTTLSATPGVLPATAWALTSSSTVNLMLTFNMPTNFNSSVSSPTVHIHYLTGPNSSPPSGTVNLDVFFCSAAAVTNVSSSCFVAYSHGIATSDSTLSSSVYTFNHYNVTFTLSGYSVGGHVISPGDFAALTIQRLTDTFEDTIYVTSVEFDYPTD
jgi:hypothetical protein